MRFQGCMGTLPQLLAYLSGCRRKLTALQHGTAELAENIPPGRLACQTHGVGRRHAVRSRAPQCLRVRPRRAKSRKRRLLSIGEHGHEPKVITDRTALTGSLGSSQLAQARRAPGKRLAALRQANSRELALAESLNPRRVEDSFHS